MPDLDLYDRDWPIWTYGEITPPAKFVHDDDGRRGVGDLLAGLGRLHRLGRVDVALAAVHRRAASIPTRTSTRRSSCPMCGSAGMCSLNKVVIDAGVRDPRRPRRRRGSGARRQALPPHRRRRLPDHPADDRQARAMNLLTRSLGRLGGLSAGQDRRPRRRRRRAAAARCQRESVEMRTLLPGYPAVMAKLDDAEPVHAYSDAVRRPGAGAGGARPGLDLFVLDAPHLFDRPGNPYLGPDGLRLARQRPALRGAGARRRRSSARASVAGFAARRRACAMTGRRRWRRPISITTAARGRHGADGPQSRLPGPFPRRAARRARAARAAR